MREAFCDLAYRVLSLVAVLASFVAQADGIDCYKCTSINGKTQDCEDVFDRTIKTVHLIQRQCVYGLFKGTHCYKLKGEREDGTSILVRDCSNGDWGSHCGNIRYIHGDKEERISGCLEACNYDGCNAATEHASFPTFVLLLPVCVVCNLVVQYFMTSV